ncbi:hypothetical protein NVP1031O_091 [Vibrio phage 1.031.O._10N.261.46.F8]|nr:hypothetical protein NVP1031O_091 [Vibrio phage 1.031.O._10N.261.46.F8]
MNNYPILRDCGVKYPQGLQCIIYFVTNEEGRTISNIPVDFSDGYAGEHPARATIENNFRLDASYVSMDEVLWMYPDEFLSHCSNVIYEKVIKDDRWSRWVPLDVKLSITTKDSDDE